MRKWLVALLTGALIAGTADANVVIYVTARSAQVRRSTDNGASWSNFLNVTGAGFMGIAVTGTTASHTVFVAARDQGTTGQRPIYAYDNNGTLLDTTYWNDNGSFNMRPLGYHDGYLFMNAGSAGGSNIEDGSSSWTGSNFGNVPLTTALDSGWQGNDMTFVTVGGTSYQYINGTNSEFIRRRTVSGGTLGSQSGNLTVVGSGEVIHDLAFTPSGRLLVLTPSGFYVSQTGAAGGTSFTMSLALGFGASEDMSAGDMGPNGRDFVLLGNTIYAVTRTPNFYRFTLDDVNGTVSYVPGSATSIGGLSASDGVQIAVIPEPSVAWLMVLALAAVRRFRQGLSG